MSGAGYVRLNSDNPDDVEMANIGSNEKFNVTILSKEKQYPIQNVSASMTLSEFKERVKEATEIEVIQQRLIFAGRRLDVNSKTLLEYKVTSPCTIHLFPIPIANLATASSSSSSSSAPATATATELPRNGRSTLNPILADGEFGGHTPMHFDENVSLHSREVKLWCLILMFLCIMDLMDIVSALLTDPGGTATLFHYLLVIYLLKLIVFYLLHQRCLALDRYI